MRISLRSYTDSLPAEWLLTDSLLTESSPKVEFADRLARQHDGLTTGQFADETSDRTVHL